MFLFITKRDGRIESFQPEKIANAIEKAICGENIDYKQLTNEVINDLQSQYFSQEIFPTVEVIQDTIERILIKHNFAKTAKSFILYRQQRTNARQFNTDLVRIYRDLTEKSSADMDLKRENANIDCNSPMGIMLRFGSEAAKDYAKKYVIKPEHALAHDKGDIHIHDLDFYLLTINCCQIDLTKLFKHGFSTGHGYLREPNSIQTAAALCCIAIQSNQNDMHGGQSVPMFEYDLAPYVAKTYLKNLIRMIETENVIVNNEIRDTIISKGMDIFYRFGTIMSEEAFDCLDEHFDDYWCEFSIRYLKDIVEKFTERDVYQAMEALIHNLNSMQSRAGSQVPFSSVNYGTGTTPEQRLIIRSILEATDKGLGNGETPIFPVQVFKVKDGVNTKEGDPNYDLFKLACKVSAKRLFPNFVFLDAPYNLQYYKEGHPETEVATMGCVSGDSKVIIFKYETEPEWDDIIYPRLAWKTYTETSGFGENYQVTKNIALDEAIITTIKDVVENHELNPNITYRVYDTKNSNTKYGGFVKILNFIHNKSVKNWMRILFEGGRYLTLTDDHYLPIENKGRIQAKDVCIGDVIETTDFFTKQRETSFFNNEKEKYGIIDRHASVIDIQKLNVTMDSYCLETESDTFDINGICSHNCRTRVIGNDYDETKEVTPGRGNLSFTTINLPRLGIEAKGDLSNFFKSLDHLVEMCFEQLLDRFGIIAKKHVYNYPFLMGQGVWIDSDKLDPDDTIEEVMKHGTMSVGFIGLAECLKALIGKHHGESEEAQMLGVSIISHMRQLTDKMTEKTGLNFSLFSTPAEGLCLAGETLVQTSKGLKQIRDIKAGEEVLTFKQEIDNIRDVIKHSDGKFEFKKVLKSRQTSPNRRVIKLTFTDGFSVICTPDHPLLSIAFVNSVTGVWFKYEEAQKVNLSTLFVGSEYDSKTNTFSTNYSTCHLEKIETLTEEIPVYDLTIEDNPNFFVGGEKAVCVHNSGRFVKMDREKYGEIQGITDKDYYTNSFHIPVYYNITAARKIELEAPYHALCNAGAISYVEMDGDLSKNVDAFESIVLYMKKCGIGYGSINHPLDRCPVCGYVGVINDMCPKCQRHDKEGVTLEHLHKIGVICCKE